MTIHRSDLVLLKSSIADKCEKCPLMDGKEKTCQTANKDTFLRFVLETELSDPCSKYKIQFKDKIAEIWRLNKGDLYLYRDEVAEVKEAENVIEHFSDQKLIEITEQALKEVFKKVSLNTLNQSL